MTVAGTSRVIAKPKTGSEQQATQHTTFVLRRNADSWIIERVDER